MARAIMAGVLLSGFLICEHARAAPEIWVSSFLGRAVQRYDADTGQFLGTFTNSPITGAEGLMFGQNGNLLVVSRNGNRVHEFDRQTGDFVRVFIDEGLDFPHGMIADEDGNILIASRNGVMKYDGLSGDLLGVFAQIPGALIDLEFGPNGNLFVVAQATNEVIEVDAQTGDVLGTFASGGGLYLPGFMLFGGSDNDLFVGGSDPDAVFRYDGQTGQFLGVFAATPEMISPSPILAHPNGNLLISTGSGNSILEYDFETGDLVRTFADEGLQFATAAIFVPAPASALLLLLGVAIALHCARPGSQSLGF